MKENSEDLAMSLTGKWPISEDTLSETYTMLPHVVNATKNPSRACKKKEKQVKIYTKWMKQFR